MVEQLIESTLLADMMELVDMPGLGSGDHNRGGSSPSIRSGWNVEVMPSLGGL